MKKYLKVCHILAFLLCVCMLSMSAKTLQVNAASQSICVEFDANGGSGEMDMYEATITSTKKLIKKNFTYDGYYFDSWNTARDGSGNRYVNQEMLSVIAEKEDLSKPVMLYAQWVEIPATSIKSISAPSRVAAKVVFRKVSNAAGYEIQSSSSTKFEPGKTATLSVKKSKSSGILRYIPVSAKKDTKMRFRVRYLYNVNGEICYSKWSEIKSKKYLKSYTLDNVTCSTGIEADITMKGSGSGYHAKLVACTPTSAVSWGIQYDVESRYEFAKKKPAVMFENVEHNGAGGQTYYWPYKKALKKGKTYHLMLAVDKKGYTTVYLNYKKMGKYRNVGLSNEDLVYIRCEGSARKNGDKVDASFGNIRLKSNGHEVHSAKSNNWASFTSCKSIKAKKVSNKPTITVKGKLTGLTPNQDWDSAYESVSGIMQYVE